MITDVTGVKSEIVFKIQALLKDTVEFVPAHPMAGKEVYGVENSDKKFFKEPILLSLLLVRIRLKQ